MGDEISSMQSDHDLIMAVIQQQVTLAQPNPLCAHVADIRDVSGPRRDEIVAKVVASAAEIAERRKVHIGRHALIMLQGSRAPRPAHNFDHHSVSISNAGPPLCHFFEPRPPRYLRR